MIITKIDRQIKNPSRYSVFIDGEFAFGIDGTDLLYFKLKEYAELDQPTYDYILNEIECVKAKDCAARYLGYRVRSRKEVVDKLKEKEFGAQVIERVMEMLTHYGYVDDRNFAKLFIRDKMRLNGFGKIRIKNELKRKGVSDADIDHAYTQLFDEDNGTSETNEPSAELQNAVGALQKKLRNTDTIDYKEKKRLYDFLARRGFSSDTINKAFSVCHIKIQNDY